MFAYHIQYLGNLAGSEAPALRQSYRRQPQFRVSLRLFHMDVQRFVAFQAKEEKPVALARSTVGMLLPQPGRPVGDHRHGERLLLAAFGRLYQKPLAISRGEP